MNFSFIIYIKTIIVLMLLSSCNNISGHSLETQDTATEAQKRLEEKANEAMAFCEKNNYNTDFCVLIDMKIHSGRNRMFVWNFKTKSIDQKALCAHGCGKGENLSTGAKPVFSNTDGSLCSSVGKYKLGIRSYSQWGINVHYKMHGLEKTNNNAYKRIIVFHSHTPMPTKEIYPQHLPMGWSFGCPVTSDEMMRYMDKKLQTNKKPTLMWIYY
ncbi:murein L,D-transpeptidase catalytic domain-containing protein [Dysgonomonas sp. GY617]|uniref:murein L,D-transpeptidase catalytic domain-containing protein n=1 Tax=Dysgonomonas sp. GY617 TaxID=2780420 RepID=UPI0018832AC9|nr:murein L,D-transpeptidase catalytic domain family protein [Dysgonomonas sp. GY617]MBF0575275.1 murein L,D-transpeptidase catalytic domain family protein [Dysgonomonas sp. GY617]